MYMNADDRQIHERELVFEFALSGFSEKHINLQFKGDYMVLSAGMTEEQPQEDRRYFKRRLKFKPVKEQKYYVPANKFDRDKVSATFNNGLLKIIVPPREDYNAEEGIKVEIKKGKPPKKETKKDTEGDKS